MVLYICGFLSLRKKVSTNNMLSNLDKEKGIYSLKIDRLGNGYTVYRYYQFKHSFGQVNPEGMVSFDYSDCKVYMTKEEALAEFVAAINAEMK